MSAENPQNKRQSVSFTLAPDVNDKLKELEQHTVFVATVVTRALGYCPCCNQPWPKKGKAKTKPEADHEQAG